MNSGYSVSFEEDLSYRYTMNIVDENDIIKCKIRLPVDIYDEILANLSEYRFSNYSVISIDIPPNSMRYKYSILLLNKDEYMIVKKIDIMSGKLIEKYYIPYINI